MSEELEQLRARLTELDTELIRLAAERQRIVSEIGQSKIRQGRGTRDYRREKVVIDTARANAERFGLPPLVAEQLMQLLIRSSLTRQEREMVMAHGGGSGRRALVIGGLGKLGRWFVNFLSTQGYQVQVADPAGSGQPGVEADWQSLELDYDLIVVAAPLKASGEILLQLAEKKPAGVIFDLASLKSPVRAGLLALKAAGCQVTSIHPMFGPDTQLLSGKHVIFIDLGCEQANALAHALFRSTMAVQVDMGLEEHDRLIAYVLGISHAINILFFSTLAESGESADKLARMSSTTFDQQLAVATRVAGENPHLYFEIQTLNDYREEALQGLEQALAQLLESIREQDEAAFVRIMEQGRAYLEKRVVEEPAP